MNYRGWDGYRYLINYAETIRQEIFLKQSVLVTVSQKLLVIREF